VLNRIMPTKVRMSSERMAAFSPIGLTLRY
jgi:hypothetical protein